MTIDDEIEELKKKHDKEMQALLNKKEAFKFLDPAVMNLADSLHNQLCGLNHIDGCDWFYDKGDWIRYSRKRYYGMAQD